MVNTKEMTGMYKIDEEKIAGLRKFADAMNFNDLLVLISLMGLRMTQEATVDMLQCGEISFADTCNTMPCMRENAAMMMEDMITVSDLEGAMRDNDLGDYTVQPVRMEFRTTV